MTIGFVIKSLFELAAIAFVVYGLWHEDKFIKFEQRMIRKIRRKIFIIRRNREIIRRSKQGTHLKAVKKSSAGRSRGTVRQAYADPYFVA